MEPNEPHFNLPFQLIITVSCLAKGISMETPLNPPLTVYINIMTSPCMLLVSLHNLVN